MTETTPLKIRWWLHLLLFVLFTLATFYFYSAFDSFIDEIHEPVEEMKRFYRIAYWLIPLLGAAILLHIIGLLFLTVRGIQSKKYLSVGFLLFIAYINYQLLMVLKPLWDSIHFVSLFESSM